MNAIALDRRLRTLENGVPIIDTLAAYALWRANGRDPTAKWDPAFKHLLEEAFAKMKERREHLL